MSDDQFGAGESTGVLDNSVERISMTKRLSGTAMRGVPQALRNPFPGLRPFGPEEAHLFFGRELHVEGLLAKLSVQRLSIVIGSSGSGKSSLVLAGVLPRLRRGYRSSALVAGASAGGRSMWRIAQMRPGDDPMKHLAEALHSVTKDVAESELEAECDSSYHPKGTAHDTACVAEAGSHAPATDDLQLDLALLEAQLRRSQQGLVEACQALALDPNENLLLVVDQFEELFRFRQLCLARDPLRDPATAFVKLLLCATEQRSVPIHVILTMRADFLGECVQFSGLAEAVNAGQYLLPLLTRDQRESIIRGPMAVTGAAISPVLVQRLLNDAGDMTDQLPVLQHALMRSFEAWQIDVTRTPELQLGHYTACGGLGTALNQHAEEALAEVAADLGDEGIRIAARLFRALTERGAHGRGVRRPCRASEIVAVAGTTLDRLNRVVQRFVSGQRGFLLLQPANLPLSGNSLIDISHEALMRLWSRLRQWSADEFAFANQLQYLDEAQKKRARGVGGLWRDPELSLALSWIEQERPASAATARYGVSLNDIEVFLAESVAAQKAALATELDAKVLQRFRRIFTDAKRSSLFALLALPILLILQGSGIFEQMLPLDTRFKLLSVAARYFGADRTLDQRLTPVVIDAQTLKQFASETRHGELLGAMGPNWRVLQAEALSRLSHAGAKVVVFDVSFGAVSDPTPLVSEGTQAFADAIVNARAHGTAVVLAADAKDRQGRFNTDPKIRKAIELTRQAGEIYAPGHIASPCLGIPANGAAVYVTLLTTHRGQADQPSLGLAALTSFWGTPNVFLDGADRMLFLNGPAGQRDVGFAGFGRELAADSGCESLLQGDLPAQQLVDLSPVDLTRATQGVIPFEAIINGMDRMDLSGRIVVIGAELFEPGEPGKLGVSPSMLDGHSVMQCGSLPWSCAWTDRWGMSLHVDAINNLLRGRAIRPIAPLTQLLLILGLCVGVAWHRVRNRQKSAWVRRGYLTGFVMLDLVIVTGAAVLFEVLMDEVYHLLAMLGTYYAVARLDGIVRRFSE